MHRSNSLSHGFAVPAPSEREPKVLTSNKGTAVTVEVVAEDDQLLHLGAVLQGAGAVELVDQDGVLRPADLGGLLGRPVGRPLIVLELGQGKGLPVGGLPILLVEVGDLFAGGVLGDLTGQAVIG